MWLPTLPRRFGIFLEKIVDRHERSGIAVQWNGGGGGGAGGLVRETTTAERFKLIGGGHFSAILVIVCLTKLIFKLAPGFDGSNPYMKNGRNPIKMTKLE